VSFFTSIAVAIFTIRLSMCLPQYREGSETKTKGMKISSVSTMVYWGSGGHTTEMIRLITNLQCEKYHPLYFIQSHSDSTSRSKIFAAKLRCEQNAIWKTVYRNREVKQSWISTIFTTIYSTIECFFLVLRCRPKLILCNGPGTCVSICYSAFLLRLLGVCQPTIVYVESFCRVTSLSLSGRLIYPVADKFIVQWPELTSKYDRAEYLGRIC
jgi:beta-1,4-N-acetylglucosaminyltransferase